MDILTEAELKFYKVNGFVAPQKPLFEGAKLQKLTELTWKTIQQNSTPEKPVEIQNLLHKNPDFLDFILEDRILDMLEKVLGPNIGLRESCAIIKWPGTKTDFTWHSDFNHIEFYEELAKIDSVTLIIAITPSRRKSGCLEFVPKTHLPRSKRKYAVPPGSESPVFVELQGGYGSLHDVHVLHQSGPNQSSEDRILLNFRFFSTEVSLLQSEAVDYLKKTFMGRVHLRGSDQSGVCAYSIVGPSK